MKVIAFSGKQGSGKDTIAAAVRERLVGSGHTVSIEKFAGPIYQMHDACIEVLRDHGIERNITKDGDLLQLLGTDWGRKVLGEDVWVKCMTNKLTHLDTRLPFAKRVVLVTDLRFENEFYCLQNAFRVRLECCENVRRKRCSMWRTNTNHPSETGLDKISYDGSFDLYLDTDLTGVEECASLVMKDTSGANFVW